MKKLIFSLMTILASGAIYALPVGNPSEASLFLRGVWWDDCCEDDCCCMAPCNPCGWFDALSLRAGFYGDYVFNHSLEVHDETLGESVIQRTEMYTSAGYLALNFCNVIDVFATLGSTRFKIHTDDSSFFVVGPTIPLSDSVIEFNSAFSWSVGARATLFEWCCFALGIEGQYFRSHPELNYFLDAATTFVYFDDVRTRYEEAQVGLGLSYRFVASSIMWVPYVAAKWSWVRWDLQDENFIAGFSAFLLPELRNHKQWGFALGMTMTLCDMIGVTVEGRWADERAIYVNGQFRF